MGVRPSDSESGELKNDLWQLKAGKFISRGGRYVGDFLDAEDAKKREERGGERACLSADRSESDSECGEFQSKKSWLSTFLKTSI